MGVPNYLVPILPAKFMGVPNYLLIREVNLGLQGVLKLVEFMGVLDLVGIAKFMGVPN